jgi:hypothetical protein
VNDDVAPPYRLLVTGSRTWKNAPLITRVLAGVHREHPGAVLVSGHCPEGADMLAERCWAWLCGCWSVGEAIDAGRIEVHPIGEYRQHGRGAGPVRNTAMVKTAPDELVAFQMPCVKKGCRTPGAHDSHGTSGCHSIAVGAGIPSRLFRGTEPAMTTLHNRETATPGSLLGDPDLNGLIIADCSCGGTYTVPEGGDEHEALEAAHRQHVATATEAGS